MSRNSMLAAVMGTIHEDVPVPLGMLSRRSIRDRARASRVPDKRKQPVDDSYLDNVGAVIGESDMGREDTNDNEASIIPKDAKDVDTVGSTLTTKLKPIKDVVQEPSYPSGAKEKLLTPYAALTAPDATPDSMTPIDPSKIPGSSAGQNSFKWSELSQTAPAEPTPEMPDNGSDPSVNAMDTILGRKRNATPPRTGDEFQQSGAITTESQAYAALGINPNGVDQAIIAETAAAKAAAAMCAGSDPTGASAMPEHKPSDSKKIYETFRRYM